MRAALIQPAPDGGSLAVVTVPDPAVGANDVLVRVVASGLNRGEVKQVRNARSGAPRPIGVEFVGVVAAVGTEVTGWTEGDRVMGHGVGGQAELVVAAPGALLPIPDELGWLQAATFPNVFVTAHDALVTNGKLAEGETVLVNAASSGIGLAATRIAKALAGATVIATTRSPDKAAQLRAFGVDHVVVAGRDDQVGAVEALTNGRGVDVVIDSVGGTVFEENLACMAVQGRLISIGRLGSSTAQLDLDTLWYKRLHLIGVTFQTRTEAERQACIEACGRDLLGPLARGELDMPIDRTFPLDDIAAAHAYMQRDAHLGKIVISIGDEQAAATGSGT